MQLVNGKVVYLALMRRQPAGLNHICVFHEADNVFHAEERLWMNEDISFFLCKSAGKCY